MDLLDDSRRRNKKEKTQAQKVILLLLVISVILCLIVAATLIYFSTQDKEIAYSIAINGQVVDLDELQLMNDANENKYVSLRALCSKIGYTYYNGEYKVADEGRNKGYVDTNKNLVQFFSDSKEIYKAIEDSYTDYEYYTLANTILEYEGNIFIALNDLPLALNLILDFSQENNQAIIQTPEYWLAQREDAFEERNITTSEEPENLRALAYGYLIINQNNRYGVISLTGSEIIGNKYSSISFCEYTGYFIVSDTQNKFGVITRSGMSEIDLQYDSLEILNYEPLLYQVERLGKLGVIDEDGRVINTISYDSIAYPENKAEEINYTLIVSNLNENIPLSIVVCSDKKYGLIEVETGREIVPCMLDGIYSKADDKTVFYARMQNDSEYLLEDFVENYNRLTTAVD